MERLCARPGCPRAMTDHAVVCREDVAPLRRQLELVARCLDDRDLDTELARQDRKAPRGGSATRTVETDPADEEDERLEPGRRLLDRRDPRAALRATAEPADLDAAQRADAALGELTTWARTITHDGAGTLEGLDHAGAVRYLADRLDTWLRWRDEAEEAWPAIADACRQFLGVVDAPPQRQYVGPCGTTFTDGPDCAEELYAVAGRAVVTCPACGITQDVVARKASLLERSGDQLLPATEMARALSGLGRPVTPSMIRGWAHRHRLTARGTDGDDPTYRLSEVIELIGEQERRRAELDRRPKCGDCGHVPHPPGDGRQRRRCPRPDCACVTVAVPAA